MFVKVQRRTQFQKKSKRLKMHVRDLFLHVRDRYNTKKKKLCFQSGAVQKRANLVDMKKILQNEPLVAKIGFVRERTFQNLGNLQPNPDPTPKKASLRTGDSPKTSIP